MLVSMGGLALVLCGGLIVMMEYFKTEYRIKKVNAPAAAAPAGPYDAKLKDLGPQVYSVVHGGLDQPEFFGRYVRTTEPGLYLDIVSGEVLFTSLDKLESAHGHAEFSKPFDPARLIEKEEKSAAAGEVRPQVYSVKANSYLGWIAKDDPPGTRRFVINSNALQFVPVAELEKSGLGQHQALFSAKPAPPPAENGGTP
jgi:peptide methionine sulfoxide reductase MsrB